MTVSYLDSGVTRADEFRELDFPIAEVLCMGGVGGVLSAFHRSRGLPRWMRSKSGIVLGKKETSLLQLPDWLSPLTAKTPSSDASRSKVLPRNARSSLLVRARRRGQ